MFLIFDFLGAETLITKRLACDNEGIFYNVEDDADLGRIMSSYYAYYAAAVKNTGVRWMSFDEAATGIRYACSAMRTELFWTSFPMHAGVPAVSKVLPDRCLSFFTQLLVFLF